MSGLTVDAVDFTAYIMFVKLHPNQSVSVLDDCVYFQHITPQRPIEFIVLNRMQMENLSDIIINLSCLKEAKHMPLGGGVWITLDYPVIEMHDYENRRKFRFYSWSWRRYINSVHSHIYSFAYCNAASKSGERNALDGGQLDYRPRMLTSQLSTSDAAISRSSGNGCHEDEQWTKCASVSRRQDSDFGTSPPRKRRKNEIGVHQTTASPDQDVECASDTNGDSEHCFEISYEDSIVLEEDC